MGKRQALEAVRKKENFRPYFARYFFSFWTTFDT
jgi:hypothetical protein